MCAIDAKHTRYMLSQVNPFDNIIQKGYLLFLETRTEGWVKRWAFISRPYLFITNHEKDPVIRVAIRLADITIQFSEDQGGCGCHGNDGNADV